MAKTIKVKPNQSLLDVIVQGCGTLEGGMQAVAANGSGISDYPDVGSVLSMDKIDTAKSDSLVLKYLQQNGTIIGTLGNGTNVAFRVLLKPVMHVVPNTTSPPSVTGEYDFDFAAATGFINVYPIQHAHYPDNNNFLWYETEERYVFGEVPDSDSSSGNFMDDELLPYRLAWVTGRGFMMVWSDLGAPVKTATFVDTMGNEAYVAPLIVLDNSTQNVEEYLIADIHLDLVSVSRSTATLRLTRSHSPVGHVDFTFFTMNWMYDAAGGAPDPLDPSNPDKTIIVLPRGKYKLGVVTIYAYRGVTYPPSAFSMVIEIS